MRDSTIKKHKHVGNVMYKAERLTRDIKIDPATGCHVWQGGMHRQGYGMMGYIDATTLQKYMTVVHRIAMIDHLDRELDSQEFVIHKCDNLKCINPDHLIVGDSAKRYQVMREKGHEPKNRSTNKVRGVNVKQRRNYRYSDEEITWIRNADVTDIAAKYGLARTRAATLRWTVRKGFKWLK
jgi:hypothetical protein